MKGKDTGRYRMAFLWGTHRKFLIQKQGILTTEMRWLKGNWKNLKLSLSSTEKESGFLHYETSDCRWAEGSFNTHRMRCFFKHYIFKLNSLLNETADAKRSSTTNSTVWKVKVIQERQRGRKPPNSKLARPG